MVCETWYLSNAGIKEYGSSLQNSRFRETTSCNQSRKSINHPRKNSLGGHIPKESRLHSVLHFIIKLEYILRTMSNRIV